MRIPAPVGVGNVAGQGVQVLKQAPYPHVAPGVAVLRPCEDSGQGAVQKLNLDGSAGSVQLADHLVALSAPTAAALREKHFLSKDLVGYLMLAWNEAA